MRSVIIAPHPDDEWIGCGCTLLKELDAGNKVLVLVITCMDFSEHRLEMSEKLARKYGYKIRLLKQPELKIDPAKLVHFFKKAIRKDDTVYIPDHDEHPDHRLINSVASRLGNEHLYEYCVYNNSRNILPRIRNKIIQLLTGTSAPSFFEGREDFRFTYRLTEKKKNIIGFGEVPRGADCLRRLGQERSIEMRWKN